MLEVYGDIWELATEKDAIVITTNGYIKKNGEAVMGRGIALEAKERFSEFPAQLGMMLTKYGNKVFGFRFSKENPWLFTLPVKPERGPRNEPGFRAVADISLIEDSIKQLVGRSPYYGLLTNLADANTYVEHIYMPRPGCGNGRLKWEQVKPVIEPYLDDRFIVCHN